MNSTVGVLMIHGTLGSPDEYNELDWALQTHGYRTRVVSLPGHGNKPQYALNKFTAQNMIDHCLAEYTDLARICDEIIIIGHSLGGILSLLTAATQPPKLKGVIAFGTPYEQAYTVNYRLGWLSFPSRYLLKALYYAPQVYTGCKAPRFFPWWYPKLYREAVWLLQQLQHELPDIQAPVSLLHSPYDMIVPYAEMEKIAQRINRPQHVTMKTLWRCGHQVFPSSHEQAACTNYIFNFIAQHTHKDTSERF